MTGLSCARTLMLVAMKNSAAGKSARMCQERRIELSSYAKFKARQQDHDHTRCVVQIHLEIFSRGCQSMQANIRELLVRSFSNLNMRTSPLLRMHAGLLDDAGILAAFRVDERAELIDRHRLDVGARLHQPRSGVGLVEHLVDLAIEPRDDRRRRPARREHSRHSVKAKSLMPALSATVG